MTEAPSEPARCAAKETDDGTVRIFDTTNDAAWIESDTTLSLAWQT
ncbi:hypothetical protein SAMN05192552_100234 [Natrinema hispanicum]|uniref:Uncharacterized protein n=1 Tax=Natrinema hispanicum TaxID=392421 RepID=A0A1H9YBA5_9EURY|nr:hypothetical protein SAMN05192552_100234 [Natrinema hispanicum]SES66157.1 hypothetical protein SAMN04488694_10134 [Natrinema hispanicum]